MGVYARHILPRIIDVTMRAPVAKRLRGAVVPGAAGEVLEVGIGSGLNLPFYGPDVLGLVGVDPSDTLLAMTRRRTAAVAFPVETVTGSAEAMALDAGRFDCVVMTWSLCSIADPRRALAEMRRVLKPSGRLLFVEHGRAPEPAVARWQDRLTPLWRRCAGGCHINRPIDRLVSEAGFALDELQTAYADGPRVFSYMFQGTARRG
jgi:ubiquinone/menaquinone biosynthesis C-methylase UbiE